MTETFSEADVLRIIASAIFTNVDLYGQFDDAQVQANRAAKAVLDALKANAVTL